MKDLEERLRSVRMIEPSAKFDYAMGRIFAEATPVRLPLLKRPVALWQCVLACAASMLLVVAIQSERGAPPPPQVVTERTVYIFGSPEQDQRAFDLLLNNQDLPFADPSKTRVIVGTGPSEFPKV